MTDRAPVTIRRVAIGVVLTLALPGLAACGGGGTSSPSSGAVSQTAAPPPPPPPPPPPQYQTTAAPFGLTQSRDLDVFGWDEWPGSPVPSAMKLRWNSGTTEYEVQPAGSAEFARLRKLFNSPGTYDAFSSSGALLSYQLVLFAPTGTSYVGDARIFSGGKAQNFVAFGIGTPEAGLPTSGRKRCEFALDEIGNGVLLVDFGAGTASGTVDPFWLFPGNVPRYDIPQSAISRSAPATISSPYGTEAGNLIEARFFGPNGEQIGVRSKGRVTGIMTGNCTPTT